MKRLLCIDDSKNAMSKYFKNWVVEGEVYTVRRMEGSLHGEIRVLLNEIKNDRVFVPELASSIEVGFAKSRFIELEEDFSCKENEEIYTLKENV